MTESSSLNILECKASIPSVAGLEEGKLNVGRSIELFCHGPVSSDFNMSSLQLKSESHYIKLLKAERLHESGLKLIVTSYTVGNDVLGKITLSDGKIQYLVKAENLNFESVLVPKPDGSQPDTYGPILPIKMNFPILYWVFLALVILGLLIFISVKVRRFLYYKSLKNELKNYESAIDPDTQFYRTLRSLEKKVYPLSELERAFRLYCLRTYQIPSFVLSDEKLIKYFKHNLPGEQKVRLQLQKLLGEFEQFRNVPQTWEEADRADFIKKLYRFVDQHKKEAANV